MASPSSQQQPTLASLWASGDGAKPSSATAATTTPATTTRAGDAATGADDTSRAADADSEEDPRWQGTGWRIPASEVGCPYNVRAARVRLYARPNAAAAVPPDAAAAFAPPPPPPNKRRRTSQQQQQQLTLDPLIVSSTAAQPLDRRRDREMGGSGSAAASTGSAGGAAAAAAAAAPRRHLQQSSRPCPECGMMYARGHVEDERVHAQYHARALGAEAAGAAAGVSQPPPPPPPADGIALPPSLSSSSSSSFSRGLLRYDLPPPPPPPKKTAPAAAAANFFGSRRPLAEAGGFLAQRAQQQRQQQQQQQRNGKRASVAAPSPSSSSSCRIVAVLPRDTGRHVRAAVDAARRARVLPPDEDDANPSWSALLLHLSDASPSSSPRATAILAVRAGVVAERGGFGAAATTRRPAARGAPVFLGVLGLWVAPALRRRRVATRTLDAARALAAGGTMGATAGAPLDRARVAVSLAALQRLLQGANGGDGDGARRQLAAFFRFYCGAKEEGDATLAVF